MPRVYRPDLSEHFILVHPGRQWGILFMEKDGSAVKVASYHFDKDGDLIIGRRENQKVDTTSKGRFIQRSNHRAYLHDFIKPRPNPYA